MPKANTITAPPVRHLMRDPFRPRPEKPTTMKTKNITVQRFGDSIMIKERDWRTLVKWMREHGIEVTEQPAKKGRQ